MPPSTARHRTAQAAALIGDFSQWKEVWMTKDQWGVWEVILPDGADGKPAIPHKSRLKVKLQAPGGWWVGRAGCACACARSCWLPEHRWRR
jgi:1,4-alpha-glucan branching enzyme